MKNRANAWARCSPIRRQQPYPQPLEFAQLAQKGHREGMNARKSDGKMKSSATRPSRTG